MKKYRDWDNLAIIFGSELPSHMGSKGRGEGGEGGERRGDVRIEMGGGGEKCKREQKENTGIWKTWVSIQQMSCNYFRQIVAVSAEFALFGSGAPLHRLTDIHTFWNPSVEGATQVAKWTYEVTLYTKGPKGTACGSVDVQRNEAYSMEVPVEVTKKRGWASSMHGLDARRQQSRQWVSGAVQSLA